MYKFCYSNEGAIYAKGLWPWAICGLLPVNHWPFCNVVRRKLLRKTIYKKKNNLTRACIYFRSRCGTSYLSG